MADADDADDAGEAYSPALSDLDIQEAMAEIPGYLDITASDFRELYRVAVRHAADRVDRTRLTREAIRRPRGVVRPDDPLLWVAERMARDDVSFVPVVDAGERVVGVLCIRDLLGAIHVDASTDLFEVVSGFCAGRRQCLSLRLSELKVRDVMKPAIVVAADATWGEIRELQKRTGHARYPVVEADGRLIGVVAMHDLLRIAGP
jgi:CBS domain-containing protein